MFELSFSYDSKQGINAHFMLYIAKFSSTCLSGIQHLYFSCIIHLINVTLKF